MSEEKQTDELVLEYLDKVKQENVRLLDQNKKLETILSKRRPVTLVDFRFFGRLWDNIYNSEGWSFSVIVTTIGVTIFGCVLAWHAMFPSQPEKPAMLTGNFFVQGDMREECYYVIQEYDNGGHMASSPCIKDSEKAVNLRRDLEKAYREAHPDEHQDLHGISSSDQTSQ